MRHIIYSLLLLTTVLVLVNLNPTEAGRVFINKSRKLVQQDHARLLVSIQRGQNPPSAPNPQVPTSWIDPSEHFPRHDTPPRAQTNRPQGTGEAYNPSP
ncbi:hypothetical protein L484_009768 [Morus notabilis]|uniref:Uncharacterized protein n=1 Tax=Morus notabilis TaxID=981085 RepID=W9SH97_9ROSA|nr:hypothetical protein L484_009768 [Morus notabilis]